MQIRTWALSVRIVNLLSAATLIALQIWYMIELLLAFNIAQIITRIFAPISLSLLSFLIITSEYRFKKVVEYFKFLQNINGLVVFNLLLASMLSLEFSTLHRTSSIVVSCIYVLFALVFLILMCLRPQMVAAEQTYVDE